MRPLNKVAQRKKYVRRLEHESYCLSKAKYNLGYVYLEKPIRYGWYKHLVLRDDVSRRMDAQVFVEILEHCGTDCWGRDKRHADKVWNRENRVNRELQFPGIRRIDSRIYKKLSPKARAWFEVYGSHWHYRLGYLKYYHCLVPRHFFKLAFTRAYITKKRVLDSDIEQRMAEIKSELRSNELYELSYNAGNRKWWMGDGYHRKIRRRCKMALNQYDEDIFNWQVYRDYN